MSIPILYDEPFGLVCDTEREDVRSVLSVVRNGWDSIEVPYEHAILRFFTMAEARVLRSVCREFRDAVEVSPFATLGTFVKSERVGEWKESFPQAVTLNVIRATGYRRITRALRVFPSLRRLMLNENHFDDTAIVELAAVLPRLVFLQTLSLAENDMGDVGAIALAGALIHMPALTALNVSKNRIGADGTVAIAAALSSLPRLERFIMDNRVICREDDRVPTAFAASLPHLTCLTKLCLANVDLGGPASSALAAAALSTLTSLTVLRLTSVAIDAVALGPALCTLTELQEFHFDGHFAGPIGIAAIAQAFPFLPKLIELNLRGNRICHTSARALAATLPTLTALCNLWLDDNYIGDTGALALAPALSSLAQLCRLGLGNNRISSRGIRHLVMVNTLPARLQLLTLYKNLIDSRGFLLLMAALHDLPALRHLDLSSQSTYLDLAAYATLKVAWASGRTILVDAPWRAW